MFIFKKNIFKKYIILKLFHNIKLKMNLDNIEIEKNIKKLKDNYNKNKKPLSKRVVIKDNRIWTQKTKVYMSNIIFDINRDIKFVEKAKLLLNEIEDINISNNNNDNILKKQLEKKKINTEENPIKLYEGITSHKYASLLKNIYNKINQMNEESKNMQKFNSLGLQHVSSQYFRTSRPKSSTISKPKIFKKMRPESASTCYDSKMFGLTNNKNFINNKSKYKTLNSYHKSFRDGYKTKKRKLILNKNNDEKKLMDLRYVNLDKLYKENNKRAINLGRLNDVYRVQLNKALNQYVPKKHLKDLQQIQIEDMNVRKEIFDIKRNIDERVNERCQGLYFKREYEKYILKNKKMEFKSNSSKSMNNSYHKNKKQNHVGSFRLRANYSSRNLFDPKRHNIYQENLNNEKMKKNSQKEKIEKKKEFLKGILVQLGDALDIQPIHKFINDEGKINRKKLIKKDLIEKQKEYFPKLEEINQNLKEINGEEEEKIEKIGKDELEQILIKSEDILLKEISHNHNHNHNHIPKNF